MTTLYTGIKFVRVESFCDGKLVCEQLYLGDNHVKALVRFRKSYPEHDKCILVAETIDGNDPKNEEYIRTCIRCLW